MCNLSDGIFERGEEQKLIELVCKKVKKGKTLEIIAQELEEETDSVAAIYEAVLNAAPDYDIDRIREKIHHE